MKRLLTLCLALTGIFAVCSAQTVENRVEVTFYTPSIVRIYKAPDLNFSPKQSLSVTMQPQQVKVSRSQEKLDQNTVIDVYKTDKLTVTVFEGGVMFRDNKGNTLLAERTSDKLRQSFNIDKDEPIYGLGILQEGRMDMRGTNRRMIQGAAREVGHVVVGVVVEHGRQNLEIGRLV